MTSHRIATSGTLSNKVLHGLTPRSIAFTQVYKMATRKVTDLETKITFNHGKIVSRLSQILNISETGSNPCPQNLHRTCRDLDYLTVEHCKRVVADENDEVFEVPDRQPLETIKLRIIDARNMSHYQCSCVRLRRNCNSTIVLCSFDFLTIRQLNDFSTDCK